jgi:hypothetical protein
MIVRASLNGLRITEVPTVLRPDGRTRSPHLRTWRDGWRHLRFLLAFSPRWLFYYPALFLAIIGAAGLIALAFGPRQIGAVEFSVQTMLACATAVIVGIQAFGLAVISRSYAAHLKLLPRSPSIERAMERITLERGLFIGGVLLAIGVAAFVGALIRWGSAGFGRLDPLSSMRFPIAGMVLVVAGVQLILLSFAMSLTRIGDEG